MASHWVFYNEWTLGGGRRDGKDDLKNGGSILDTVPSKQGGNIMYNADANTCVEDTLWMKAVCFDRAVF